MLKIDVIKELSKLRFVRTDAENRLVLTPLGCPQRHHRLLELQ